MEVNGLELLKKYIGQIIFNAAAAGGGILLFTRISAADSPALASAAAVLLMAVLCGGNYFFVKLADSGKKAFQPSYMITDRTFEGLVDPQDYVDVMKSLKDYPKCRNEAQRVLEQWELFKKKSATLDAISSRGGVYEVVNQDVESVLLRNMVLFMKRAAIMQSASGNEEINAHRAYLKRITDSNDKILSDYTNLLIEASQLTGEDSGKAEVESLNILIESIRDYRTKLEKGEQ